MFPHLNTVLLFTNILCAEKGIEDNINSHFELNSLERDSECISVSGVLASLTSETLAVSFK